VVILDLSIGDIILIVSSRQFLFVDFTLLKLEKSGEIIVCIFVFTDIFCTYAI